MAREDFTHWRHEPLRSGVLAPLSLGLSQDAVVAAFGPPDEVSTTKKQGLPIIFNYADVEFHFDSQPRHRLSLIYAESEDGTPRISIE